MNDDNRDQTQPFGFEQVMELSGEDGSQSVRERIVLSPRAEQVAQENQHDAISPRIIANAMRLADFLVTIVTGILVYLVYVFPKDGFQSQYSVAIALVAVLTVIISQSMGGYEIASLRRNVVQMGKTLGAWAAVFAILTSIAFFLRVSEDFSRVWLAGSFVGGGLALLAYRSAVSSRIRKWAREGKLERRAVIIGGGESGERLIRALEAQSDADIRICGIFDDRKDERSPDMVAGYPKLGTISQLVEFGRRARIDLLIVSLPMTAESRVLQLLKKIWILPVDIRISAQSNKLRFRPRSYSYVGSVPFLDVFDKPIADWDSVLKRTFDITFSLFAIALFSPVFLMTAIAVKATSKGPILFRQKRFGFKNDIIEVMKFRSMYVEHSDPEAKNVVTKGDPRVTPVGRFIRRTSIDELPQLFNVLSGELSLVGPRPHAVNAHTAERLWDDVIDGYFGRHRVKPGVTGWAQINGWRGEVESEEKIRRRVEHDLYYIENWSVMFDLYICLATPLKLLGQENAY